MTFATPPTPDFDRVRVRGPDGAAWDVPITGSQLTIGRSGGVEVHLDHERVSRRHAEILCDPFGRWWVRDLRSRNGIRVNGHRVAEQLVSAQDVIEIWQFKLRLMPRVRPAAERAPGSTRSSAAAAPSASPEPAATLPRNSDADFEGRTLDTDAAPAVTAAQLDMLMSFTESLARTADAGRRRQMLCDQMVGDGFGGLAAFILRRPAGDGAPDAESDAGAEPRVLHRATRASAAGRPVHVSRTLLRSMWRSGAPMVGSNAAFAAGDARVAEISIDGSLMPAAGIACPLEGDAALYVTIDPQYATPDWLSLAALAARQWSHAESVWQDRERTAFHEAVERDLRQARVVQEQFLPKAFAARGFTWSLRFEPCRWVGGDYVDVVPLADGRVFVGVADVSGKGLQAALLTASLHTLIRTALAGGMPLNEIFDRANAYLREFLPVGSFVTMAAAVVDPGGAEAQFANAGHPPAFVLDTSAGPSRGEVTAVEAYPNLPLGVEEEPYVAQPIRLEPGNVLLLYTDGCTDVMSPDGERLSVGLLRQLFADAATSCPQCSPRNLVEALFERLERHRGPCLPPDDRALVACMTGG